MPCRPDPTHFVVACSSRRQLARQIRFLKAENVILRSKVRGRITLTDEDRSTLIRFAQESQRCRFTECLTKQTGIRE